MPQEVSFTADGIEEARVLLDGFEYDPERVEEVDVSFTLDVETGGNGEVTPPDEPTPVTPKTRFHFVLSVMSKLGADTEEDAVSSGEIWEIMQEEVEEDIPRPSGTLSRLYGDYGQVQRTDPAGVQGFEYYLTDSGVEFVEENCHYPE